jgi:zinc protease
MRFLLAVTVCVALAPWAARATDVQEVVSKGGITAWLVEEHNLPLLACKIVFRDSGTAYDPAGKEGRASMVSAMLMEGAGDMDATAFSKALEDHAMSLDFDVEDDMFSGSFTALSEYNELAFTYLGLALGKPRFDDVAVARVKQQMISLLQQKEKNPNYLLQRKWDEVLFGAHPYGHAPLGSQDSLSALTKEDLSLYATSYLTRDKLVIAVVGDITPEALAALLDKHLGDLPAKAAPDVVVEDVKLPVKAAQVVVQSDIPQTVALFGTQGVKRDDPAFYDAYVMNYLLGGGSLSSRLFAELREKRGLTYGISTQLTPMQHAAVWGGEFATRNEKVGDALAALRETLKAFSEKGPTDAEMKQAKQFLTGSFVLALDSNHDIANYLISMQVNHLGRDYLDKRNGLMEAVTREGVKKVAARLADPAQLQVVMVGKPVLGEPAAATQGKAP